MITIFRNVFWTFSLLSFVEDRDFPAEWARDLSYRVNDEMNNRLWGFGLLSDDFLMNPPQRGFQVEPLASASLAFQFHNEYLRQIPFENSLSKIRAVTAGLAFDDSGSVLSRNGDLRLSAQSRAHLSRHFFVYSELAIGGSKLFEHSRSSFWETNELYSRVTFSNLSLLIGKSRLMWGPSDRGGLLFSNQGPTFSMVKLGAAEAFKLPWFLSHLGLFKPEFVVSEHTSTEGGRRAFLIGKRLSFLPSNQFEVGLSHVFAIGNSSTAKVHWLDPIKESFFIRKSGLRGETISQDITDHRFGLDFILRPIEGVRWEVYGDFVFEDLGKESLVAQLVDYMATCFGVWFATSSLGPLSSFRFEFYRVPPIVFRHDVFGGHVIRHRLYGTGIEPDSHSLRFRYELLDRPMGFWFESNLEFRHFGKYRYEYSKRGKPERVVLLETIGQEDRVRFEAGLVLAQRYPWTIETSTGVQKIFDFNFEKNNDPWNLLIGATISYSFGPL